MSFAVQTSPMRTGCADHAGTIPARFPSVSVASEPPRLYTRKRAPGKLSPTRNYERLRSELQSPVYALFPCVSFPGMRPNPTRRFVMREMHFVTRCVCIIEKGHDKSHTVHLFDRNRQVNCDLFLMKQQSQRYWVHFFDTYSYSA